MLKEHENLMLPINFNAGMAQARTQEEKMMFLLKALTQYERDMNHDDENMRPSQVVVHPNSAANPAYLLDWHTIRMAYVEDKTCTAYLVDMEHEHEHAQQRKGAGYTEPEKMMCDVSFAVYPKQTLTAFGFLRHEYAYNYAELRALQAEGEWIHSRYHARMHASPPCLVPEQKEILDVLKNTYERIKGRPSKSDALAVNRKNARKAFWGKYNPKYAPGMTGFQVARQLRKGAPLIKQTMKDLRELEKVLKKDIAALEKALSPKREAETRRESHEKLTQYYERVQEQLPEIAKSAGFDIVDKIPTDDAYTCCQCDSVQLLEFYLRAFNKDLQYTPEAAGKLHIYQLSKDGGQMASAQYLVMIPKSVADKVHQPEHAAPVVQSVFANNGITYDDQINAEAIMSGLPEEEQDVEDR